MLKIGYRRIVIQYVIDVTCARAIDHVRIANVPLYRILDFYRLKQLLNACVTGLQDARFSQCLI